MKIVCQPHVAFAARHLVNQLEKLGRKALIVDQINPRDKDIHIIYNVHELSVLPENFICMQTEVAYSHWFRPDYLAKIRKAKAVWDYSPVNQANYFHQNKAIVTPGVSPQPAVEKDIEYLFYGWVEGSLRRQQALWKIQEEMPVTIINNTVGQEMHDILARTKQVINIHYYDDSPKELYRICESVSFGCKVWMYDEGEFITEQHDNLEELKHALKLAKI